MNIDILKYLTLSDSGATSDPCCMKAPRMNQNELRKVNWFS